jgi:Dehydrogenases with different specificities (related to short-chain alcohol dehydrogenases)
MASSRTIVITGASRGLGLATAEKLAGVGHRIIICSRSMVRGRQAVDQIRRALPDAQVDARVLDPASLESIHRFAEVLLQEGRTVDVLIHNAGVLQPSKTRRTTADGLEETLAVNVLGPFLLTKLLLPALERSTSARVVSISSRLHIPGVRGKPPRFDFHDPTLLNDYDPDRAYKNSKLALMWFTYELQRRLPPRSITANAVCPGFVPTTAAADARGIQRWLLRSVLPLMPFADSVEKAATGIGWAATDPSIEGVGGRFFAACAEIQSSAESYEQDKAQRFWQLACELASTNDWP